tara:strand:- start:280 stop:438 length:159 start_codon:yes stop_codon:yes gene_type:complete
MNLNRWIVYYLDKDGLREGTEIIEAETSEEAVEIYRRFFNHKGPCRAIRRIG